MNKYIIFVLLTSCSYSYAATVRDNYMCIVDGHYNTTPFKFKLDSSNSYSITPGQPFTGVSNITSGSHAGCIDVQAGRSNSATNVAWVQAQESNTEGWWNFHYVSTTDTSNSSLPLKLNFAVQGTLQIEINNTFYTCPHTILGQGNDGCGNNLWWIFGNINAYENGWTQSLYCYTQNGNAYRMEIPGSSGNLVSWDYTFLLSKNVPE